MIEVQEILSRVSEAGSLWNREPERFGQLMGGATALLINFESKQDAHVRTLERENSKQQLEIQRLEKCLEDGDYYPCAQCNGVWHTDDLETITGENFCQRCIDEARRRDAEEAAQELEDARAEREIHSHNMRNAG